MNQPSEAKISNIISGMIFLSLSLILSSGVTQAAMADYILDNVVQVNGGQMTGSFRWTYTEGDFENGTGLFTDLFIPGHGTDIDALTINFDINKSIEFSLTANVHGGGVNVSLFLVSPLAPAQAAVVDLSRSSYEIESGGQGGGFVSGVIAPFIWGDINDDGGVNIADVLLATQAVFGATLSDEQLARGNVAPLINGLPQPVDSLEALDAADLLLITQKALGTNVF